MSNTPKSSPQNYHFAICSCQNDTFTTCVIYIIEVFYLRFVSLKGASPTFKVQSSKFKVDFLENKP